MLFKRSFSILAVLLAIALLAACVRSASTPATSLPTPTAGMEEAQAPGQAGAEEPGAAQPGAGQEVPKGEPTATIELLQELNLFVTQTAAAALAMGLPTQPASQALPEQGAAYPGVATAVPGSAESQVPGQVEQPTQQPGSQAGQPAQQPGGQAGQPTSQPGSQAGQPAQQPGGQATQTTGTQPGQAAPPAIVVPTATPGRPKTYVLQGGEFPYCIARRFDVNPIELLNMNGLSSGTIVRPGTELRIPQTGHPFPPPRQLMPHPTTYTVLAGESIYQIACKFGEVDPMMIALANGLQSPYTLTAGTVLNIP